MTDTSRNAIRKRIHDLREDLDLSQTELAESIKISPRFTQKIISRIEKGDRPVYPEEIIPVAEALQTDPLFLLSGTHLDNYAIAEETGLSDHAIETLKFAQGAKIRWKKEGVGLFSDNFEAMAVNALLSDTFLIRSICEYLFSDFSTLEYYDPELDHHINVRGKTQIIPDTRTVKAENVRSVDLASFEAIFRVNILDALSKLRTSEDITKQREERIYKMSVGKSVFDMYVRDHEIDDDKGED